MHIESVETPCLGNRSYVVVAGATAVVVDPPRDIDRIEAVLEPYGATPALVVETHRHADYLSGGLELSRRHRATYVVPPGDPKPAFRFAPAIEGEVYGSGSIGIRLLATPGHTPHHVAVVIEEAERPIAVCTGGSLLYGSVGRTDLYGVDRTHQLARDQWRSARRLRDELPADVRLLPTHGFGSLCSAGTGSEMPSATIGEEAEVNPALQMAELAFADSLVAGFGPVPRHYRRLPLVNAAGPQPIDLTPPRPLAPTELQHRRGEGHWLVDVRSRTAFAEAHLRGSVNVEVTGPLVAYLPWILPAGAGVVLLGDSNAVMSATRQLAQVGIDRPLGAALGSPLEWAGGDSSLVASYAVGTFAGFTAAARRGTAGALDVRSRPEWDAGHVRGALHLALPELAEIAEPNGGGHPTTGETWVYCGGGFRAAIAASLLDAAGGNVTLINQPYQAAVDEGITGVEPQPATARAQVNGSRIG